MEIARIDVTGVRARAIIYRPIPVGMVGGTVRLEYSDHLWDGLNKTVVFQAGDITKDVVNPGDLVVIPPEITMQGQWISMSARFLVPTISWPV